MKIRYTTDGSLPSATPDVSIYYTLDGSTPYATSTLYSEPITVADSLQMKALALRNNCNNSSPLTEDYELKVISPGFSLAQGEYQDSFFAVGFTCVNSGSYHWFTRSGYNFAGWDSNGDSAADYTDGADYTMGVGDVTLTALWTANSYSITFEGNGATSGSMSPQSIDCDATVALTSNVFPKTGYPFAG